MNQKRTSGGASKGLVGLLVIGIVVALGAGILIGRWDREKRDDGRSGAGGSGLTSKDVADAKGVPEFLEDPGGRYQLIAVVEGAEANRKLSQSLQLVSNQRVQLHQLAGELDALPAGAEAQRELLSTQILDLRGALELNLRFMAENYGYSLQNNYRLIPHKAKLHVVTGGTAEKPELEEIQSFDSAASYQAFLETRTAYMVQAVEEAKAKIAEGVPEGEKGRVAASEKLKRMGDELRTKYHFDPAKNHQLDLEKTALYGRPVEANSE